MNDDDMFAAVLDHENFDRIYSIVKCVFAPW
jgi:hypothetical protein